MKKFRHGIGNSLFELFLPASCLVCGHPPVRDGGPMLCDSCRRKIKPLTNPICSCCGTYFPKAGGGNHLCGLCLSGHYRFDLARALFLYTPLVSTIISRFKYQGITAGLKSFKNLLKQLPDFELFSRPELILPVPLHPKRLRERGFNQALLLARALFPDQTGQINFKTLVRERYTEPQTGLSGKARRLNLKKAFRIRDHEVVAGKRVLLIDDVFTTGTTVNECAGVLKKAGAKEVVVLTLARVD